MINVPETRIIDGKVWVCTEHYANTTLVILTQNQLRDRDKQVVANEHKRMAYVLANMEDFAGFVQWKGNPPCAGELLEVETPWINK